MGVFTFTEIGTLFFTAFMFPLPMKTCFAAVIFVYSRFCGGFSTFLGRFYFHETKPVVGVYLLTKNDGKFYSHRDVGPLFLQSEHFEY